METTVIEPKIKRLKTVSFKEVHNYLEKQAEFLNKERDYHSFGSKGSFLDSVGFKNSVTTKAYNDLADKKDIIAYYNNQYGLRSKFILQSQVEKLCMEYNLYVRKVEDFLGDIPEVNIEQMANFTINPKDMCFSDEFLIECLFACCIDTSNVNLLPKNKLITKKNHEKEMKSGIYIGCSSFSEYKINLMACCLRSLRIRPQKTTYSYVIDNMEWCVKMVSEIKLRPIMLEIRGIMSEVFSDGVGTYLNQIIKEKTGIDFTKKWTLSDVFDAQSKNIFKNNVVLIAAVKELFSDDAFNVSDKRIYKGDNSNLYEMPPRSQVDTDPIVLVETKDGYLIVTAWGDEANSEVVVNHNFN